MKIGLISDVHSNLTALQSCFSGLKKTDEIWCLGDIVGYGPQPNECLERIAQLTKHQVMGNHDLGSLGKLDLTAFTNDAKLACQWTNQKLNLKNRHFLEKLPKKATPIKAATLAHGSPRDPIWEYILNEKQALNNFSFFKNQIAFVGHTHLPAIYELADNIRMFIPTSQKEIKLNPKNRYIINPGSVGQPRDGNPKASFLIFDTEKLTVAFKRRAYKIEKTQDLMAKFKLPDNLIKRLAFGL